MQKAEHAALFHRANIEILGIRRIELDYFNQFFGNFGTQAAILAGYSLSSISQCPSLDSVPFWPYIFWVGNAGASVTGVLAIMISLYVSVYGEGLALRGPLGSMARASAGMVVEQQLFLWAFVWTIIFLTANYVGMYFIMMTMEGAIVCALIAVASMVISFFSWQRIYNRFGYIPPEEHWTVDSNENATGFRRDSTEAFLEDVSATRELVVHSPNGGTSPASSAAPPSTVSSTGEFTMGDLSVFMRSKVTPGGYCWVRRFFVLKGKYFIYYASRDEFQRNPSEPMNNRPISLLGYSVETEITDRMFGLNLVPSEEDGDLKSWQFRCDTLEELDCWKAAMEKGARET